MRRKGRQERIIIDFLRSMSSAGAKVKKVLVPENLFTSFAINGHRGYHPNASNEKTYGLQGQT